MLPQSQTSAKFRSNFDLVSAAAVSDHDCLPSELLVGLCRPC